jgi:hypothetical protein
MTNINKERIKELELQITELTAVRRQADHARNKALDELYRLQGLDVVNDTRHLMQDMGRAVRRILPHGWGFFLLTFRFGDVDDSRCNYISDAKRQDVINVMKEWLIKAGAQEDWMKHL